MVKTFQAGYKKARQNQEQSYCLHASKFYRYCNSDCAYSALNMFCKKELAYNPILKNLVTSIFITNEVELDELKAESKKMLDRGFNVIIFPSGIRHRRDEFPKIRKGASLVALNAGKNVVPIRMFSDRDFLFINQPFYAVSDRCVNFEIEQMREINIADFIGESEIITKQRLTNKIEDELYGL